jgi:hypothetical protein
MSDNHDDFDFHSLLHDLGSFIEAETEQRRAPAVLGHSTVSSLSKFTYAILALTPTVQLWGVRHWRRGARRGNIPSYTLQQHHASRSISRL